MTRGRTNGWLRQEVTAMTALKQFIADLLRLIAFLLRFFFQRGKPAKGKPCRPCPPALKKPDPFLYSQTYLMSLGIPVTWDNPDIFIFDGSTPVDPHDLQASTTYTLFARVWNNSLDVPVVGLKVAFSYLSFGMGVQSNPIETGTTNLNAKGLPGCPAFASVQWKTPPTLGHYCVQVLLEPPSDLNWLNNLGQRNIDVARPASPATFEFDVGNHALKRERRVHFTVDTYAIPPLPACDDRRTREVRLRELRRPASPEVPEGWTVSLTPSEFVLAPNEEKTVAAEIKPPAGFEGSMPFNVHAFDDVGCFGGVTLTVEAP
jgi:hypothetical protein